MPMPVTRAAPGRAARFVVTLLAALLFAACGSAPQTPPAEPSAEPSATPLAAAPVPTAYPAPDTAAGETSYPAPDAANTVPTAYPAPLGEAPQTPASSGATAPTRPPLATTAPPAASTPPALTSLPAGMDVGEVPPDMAVVAVADLMQREGVAVDAISVVSAEAVEWPDGAVGCPRPGMMYPQVITPGYRLVLAVNGREFNYHAAEQSPFFLCER